MLMSRQMRLCWRRCPHVLACCSLLVYMTVVLVLQLAYVRQQTTADDGMLPPSQEVNSPSSTSTSRSSAVQLQRRRPHFTPQPRPKSMHIPIYINIGEQRYGDTRGISQNNKPVIGPPNRGLNSLVLAKQWAASNSVPLPPDCQPLKFISDLSQSLTALASFPGSGNTWLRHLLQQASGFHTGSFYEDYVLKRRGFAGESIHDRSVLVVKTHEWPSMDKARTKFDKAILLVRDPLESLKAEFNRRHGGHLGFARNSVYTTSEWKQFVTDMSGAWLEFNLKWLQFPGPLRVVCYRQLSAKPRETLVELCKFLQLNISQDAMNCALRNGEGVFHRRRAPSSTTATTSLGAGLGSEFGLPRDISDNVEGLSRTLSAAIERRTHRDQRVSERSPVQY